MKRKITHGKNLFIRTILVTACAFISATGWSETVDLGSLTLDTEYQLAFANAYYASYTPAEDGVLTASCTSSDILLAYYERYETKDEMVAESNTIEVVYDSYYSPRTYHFNVSAGTTYYFYNNFIMNAGTFTISMNAASSLELQSCQPAENSTISASDGADIALVFNQSVSIKSAFVSVGNTTETITARINTNTVSFELKEILFGWLQNGTISSGDNFSINLTGVTAASDNSVIYGTDGNLSITYKAAAKPIELTGSTNTSGAFLSYYVPESSASLVTLTFDGDVESATAELRFGNTEGGDGEYYTEVLEPTISGNTISIDLGGKSRRPQDMVTSGSNYNNMLLRVGSVKSKDGQFAYSEGQGTLGTYWFSYSSLEVVTANVISEFTPASGSSLEGVSSIEIWITDEDKLSYDGINFTYTSANGTTQSVVVTDFTKEQDPDNSDAAILNVPVPSEVAGMTNITVTLNNLTSADGIDHTDDVKAKYDSFVITSANPANGSTLEMISENQVLTFSTNMNDKIGCMVFQIRDLNPSDENEAIIWSLSYLQKQENGTFTYEFPFNMKLVQGHDYKVELTAYATEDDKNYGNAPLGEDYIIWHGATEAFQFSTVQFVSISPDPETTVISSVDERVFTITFDGLVNLNSSTTFINTGMGTTAPFESIVPVDEDNSTGTSMASQWILTVSESMISSRSYLVLSISATDIDGALVEGNTGSDETSYFNFTYTITIGMPELTVSPADGSTVTSLYKFVVGCAEVGLNPSWSAGDIYLYKDREQVAYVKDAEPVIPEEEQDNWEYNPVEYELFLDKEITESGNYYMIIPEGWFNLGTGYNQQNNQMTIVTYKIGGTTNLEVTIDPADGSKVTSLKTFILTFDNASDAGPSWNGDKATLTNEAGEVVAFGEADFGDDFSIYNQVKITLDTEVTNEGSYTLNIPAQLFIIDQEDSEAMTFSYYVSSNSAISKIFGEDVKEFTVYNLKGILVLKTDDQEALKQLATGLYIINGKKVLLRN